MDFVERMIAARERRAAPPDDRPKGTLRPGVLFEAAWHGWSGYAKAAREVAWRLAPSLHVELRDAITIGWEDGPAKTRIDALRPFRVHPDCPSLRFFGPDRKGPREKRPSICWTMMETEAVHSDMIRLLEKNFDEVWTPTRWNAETLRASGLELPVREMPLGVDPLVYHPARERPRLPECLLLSTDRAGEREIPEGFLFLTVGLPSLRKGWDVLVAAFEEAFGDDPGAALVIALTFASVEQAASILPDATRKSRIYALQGSYDEHRMAELYNAVDAYVSASRGEGWNLPACEAAACGKPVILPRNTAHPEVFGDDAFWFEPEGVGGCPGVEWVSPWYKGMPFSVFGEASRTALADRLRTVRKGGDAVLHRAVTARCRMLSTWTWNQAAAKIGRRLLEIQP